MASRFTWLFVFVFLAAFSARAETFTAYLSSAQEVPTNASTGTGWARVVVNEAGTQISFTVFFTGLTSNQAASHIHAPGAIGVNAGVAINIGTVGGTTGTITGTAAITPTQLSQLRAHLGYVNVHTANFGGGEIRGQLGAARPLDFDGDGKTDLSALRFPAAGGTLPITWWNSNSTAGVQVVSPFGDANLDFPAPGDYDGDGKDDLMLYRAGAAATDQSLFILFRSSDSTAVVISYGLGSDQAVSRDYDGDGKTDVAVFRPGASLGLPAFWWIRRSGSNNADSVIQWGTSGDGVNTFDTPVPGDYDGDGKADVAVYRVALSPANTFIVRRSSDGTAQFQQWGNFQTDWIVPGDYDGDGKTDFCGARVGATAGIPMQWWILQSSNGAVRVTVHGISSDFPVQGEYDGDARTDVAVYRLGATTGSQNFFWVSRSFDNVVQTIPWGIRGDFATNRFDSR